MAVHVPRDADVVGSAQQALDNYWSRTLDAYEHYPSVRHRKRLVLRALARCGVDQTSSVFDFGCGDGSLLRAIGAQFRIPAENLGGCDVSGVAVGVARERSGSPWLFHEAYPALDRRYDAVICSEVIEHTVDYGDILSWIARHLRPGGVLVLTTQSGAVHASDRYAGHTQHFRLPALLDEVEAAGLRVIRARRWGFPLFTLQKYGTDLRFDRVREQYLEGSPSRRQRLVFSLAYLSFFVHDVLPAGPQLVVVAEKG